MCQELQPLETIKAIADYAAPAITIGSGLLGLFTETKKEVDKKVNGNIVKEKALTKWAWIAMTGIIIGGAISIISIDYSRKIEQINKCISDVEKNELERQKHVQDSTYKANTDTIVEKSNQLVTTLLQSINITKHISDASKKTLSVLVNTSHKQNLALLKQDSLNIKSEQMLNPFLPFKIQLTFKFKFDSTIKNIMGFTSIQNTCKAFEEKVIKRTGQGEHSIEHNFIPGIDVHYGARFKGQRESTTLIYIDSSFQDYEPLQSDDISFTMIVEDSNKENLFGAMYPRQNHSVENVTYQLIYNLRKNEYNVSFVMSDFFMNNEGGIISTIDFKKYTTQITFRINHGELPGDCKFQSCLITFPPAYSKFYIAHFIENYGTFPIFNSNKMSAKLFFSSQVNFNEMPFNFIQ